MQVQILSADVAQYLPFAKQKLRGLADLRASAGLDQLQRYYSVGAALIFVRSSAYGDLIRIMGGGGGQIVIANGDQLWVYDYEKNQLSRLLAVDGGEVRQLFDDRVLVNKTTVKVKSKTKEMSDDTRLGAVVQKYQTEYSLKGVALRRRTVSGLHPAATLPFRDWQLIESGGNLAFAGGVPGALPWNIYGALDVWLHNPANASTLPQGLWNPAVFYVGPGDEDYDIGFYFGARGGGMWGPFSTIKVLFGALLDNRQAAGSTRYGLCEFLTEGDNSAYLVGAFYLSTSPEPTSPAAGYELLVRIDQYRYGGTALSGRPATFRIEYPLFAGTSPTEVHFWTATAEEPGVADLCGVLVAVATSAMLHRVRGGTSLLLSTTNYHSHAVSSDGRIVAVFEGAGIIETVTVFDLETSEMLRHKGKLTAAKGLSGAVIPVKPEGTLVPFEPEEVAAVEDVDTTADLPTLGGLLAPFHHCGSQIWKLFSSDGLSVEGVRHNDDCWDWVATRLTPSGPPPFSVSVDGQNYSSDTFIGLGGKLPHLVWMDNAEIILAKWKLNNGKPLPEADSVSAGSSVEVGLLTRPDMGIGLSGSGCFFPIDACGEVSLSYAGCGGASAVDGTICPDFDVVNVTDPVEVGVVTGISACGQQAASKVYAQNLTISVPSVEVGAYVIAGGGVAPITYGASGGGSVDSETGEILGLAGCGASALFTVADACGQTDEYEFTPGPADPLEIDGPATASVGSVYTASGGVRPYIWGGTNITMAATGEFTAEVTALGCGARTVTVEDACEATDSLGVGSPAALVLTGTDTPVVDSQYTAEGGTGPYTWSISCGTIDTTGKVTSVSGCCGSGTVTVEDACGQSASLTVRFATGQWVTQSDIVSGVDCLDGTCSSGSCAIQKTCTTTIGDTRTTYYYIIVSLHPNCSCNPTLGGVPPCADMTVVNNCISNNASACPGGWISCAYTNRKTIDKWQCP